jgi:hypothetical protein
MCLRRLTSACLLLRTLCFFLISGTYFVFHEMTSHISYQENNVGKRFACLHPVCFVLKVANNSGLSILVSCLILFAF